ncbi:MAG: DUF2610 domain-containing protein [Pseudomonadota bacterium]
MRALATAAAGTLPDGLAKASDRLRQEINPYRGLGQFREEDAAFYFGRHEASVALSEAVKENRFVAVVGGTGGGKSSLVRAGLLPKLRDPHSGAVWHVLDMTPGEDPLEALAARLIGDLYPESTLAESEYDTELVAIKRRLKADDDDGKGALARIAGRILDKNKGIDRLLLFVDQFEELFTLVQKEQRERFLDELIHAVARSGLPFHVVLTLRGDQYHRITERADLAALFQSGQINIAPLARSEMEEAIEAPARGLGAVFEDGLAHRISEEIKGEAGALPLVSFLLEKLWVDRDPASGAITHAAYERLGGVRGAIASRADEIYASLEPEARELTRALLLRLVRPGQGSLDSKRPAPVGPITDDARRIVDRLADERLIFADDHQIEIAHEALIREWKTLSDWVDEAREDLAMRDRIEPDAARWHALLEEDPDSARQLLLPPGLKLQEAERLVADNPQLLEGFPLVLAYVEASIEAEAARLSAREQAAAEAERARRAREAERAAALERSRRQNRRLLWAASLIAALGGVATWFYFDSQNMAVEIARQNRELEESNQELTVARDAAQQERDRAQEAYAVALDATDTFMTALTDNFADSAAIPSHKVQAILASGEDFLDEMQNRVGDSEELAFVRARMMTRFADITSSNNLAETERQLAAAEEALAKAVSGGDEAILLEAQVHRLKSVVEFERQDYQKSYDFAVLAYNKVSVSDATTEYRVAQAEALTRQGRALWKLKRYTDGADASEKCLEALGEHKASEPDEVLLARANCLHILALVITGGDIGGEEASTIKGLALYKSEIDFLTLYTDRNPSSVDARYLAAAALNNVASLDHDQPHIYLSGLKRAETAARKGYAQAPWSTDINVMLGHILHWSGDTLSKLGRRHDAAISQLEAVDLRAKLFFDDPANVSHRKDYEDSLEKTRINFEVIGEKALSSEEKLALLRVTQEHIALLSDGSDVWSTNRYYADELVQVQFRKGEALKWLGQLEGARDTLLQLVSDQVPADDADEIGAMERYWINQAINQLPSCSRIRTSDLAPSKQQAICEDVIEQKESYLASENDWLMQRGLAADWANLAQMLVDYDGDTDRAIALVEKAAAQRNKQALEILESWYRQGVLLPQNLERADALRARLDTEYFGMKRFTVPMTWWNGVERHPTYFYITDVTDTHPDPVAQEIYRNETVLGLTIPDDVKESFNKLLVIANENSVSFAELATYALSTAQDEKNAEADSAGSLQTALINAIGAGRYDVAIELTKPYFLDPVKEEELASVLLELTSDKPWKAAGALAASNANFPNLLEQNWDALLKVGGARLAAAAADAFVQANDGDAGTQTVWRYRKGIAAMEAGNFEAAIWDLTTVASVYPNTAHVLKTLGYAMLLNDQELERATGYLRRAHALAPKDPSVLVSNGWALVKTGQLDDGMALLVKATELDPDLADAWAHLGEGHRRKGAPDAAAEALAKAKSLTQDEDLLAYIEVQLSQLRVFENAREEN